MPLTTADCRRLIAYDDWANDQVMAALDGVSPDAWSRDVGGSFGSLQGTVAHLVGAAWVWLERWTGNSPTRPPEWMQSPTVASLRARLGDVAAQRRRWLDSLDDADLRRECPYRLMSGTTGVATIDVLLQQVVNHGSYHRGQIVLLLRMLGHVPPSTDFLVWRHSNPEDRAGGR